MMVVTKAIEPHMWSAVVNRVGKISAYLAGGAIAELGQHQCGETTLQIPNHRLGDYIGGNTDIPPLLQPHDSLEVNQEAFGKGSPMSSLESKDGSERDMLRTPPSDTTVSDYQPGEAATLQSSGQSYHMLQKLLEIFSENVIAKTLRVAAEALENNSPPTVYPEFVQQNGEDKGKYLLRDANFWTCGFFPGILYLLRERAVKYPHVFPYHGHEKDKLPFPTFLLRQELTSLSKTWTGPIEAMQSRTDTHDMGFIIQPSLRKDWELTSNETSLQAVLTAAKSLASRYSPAVRAIRSWDVLSQANVSITSMTQDFLVIIDSMMNLDLLFYSSSHLSDPVYADIAITHARTLIKSNLRPEAAPGRTDTRYKGVLYSHYHVINFDAQTGEVKERRTAQGYSAESTWARGQAWGIFGYAQTYTWSRDTEFLSTACGMAEYFLWRLETAPSCVERPVAGPGSSTTGRYVPLWDFDAPIEDESNPLRDSSAGVIAANGMLLLSQSMTELGDEIMAERYRSAAIKIVADTLEFSLSTERARFADHMGSPGTIQVEDSVAGQRFDAILKNATANHNSNDHDRYSDHGLVYADYYLLEFGNQLLRMGLL
ncbi:hypothetical protein V495_00250 [Pseudogymnoascus sp. VKM F-4514 (FW-929)]|nr:hypothetical protein V495_00250 [Pseudogymnoascus sp. VKM F-4514 (FW-929)]KFY67114.1 hypothetical protein V497_00543 [Pseudogymnoascus sp. VKM F-4516 (FW-969)]